MIGCLRTRVRKQPIIALYFESENELKFYNLEARPANKHLQEVLQQVVIENFAKDSPLTYCVPKSRLLKQTMNICWDNLV